MKKATAIFISAVIFLLFSFSVFADTDVNMGGADASVGQSATSKDFKWQGDFAQGIRVTAVDGSSGTRLAAPIDYTHFKGNVDVSFVKKSKLEYITSPAILDNTLPYTRTTPPSGMLTMLIGGDGGNNVEELKTFFHDERALDAIINDIKLSMTSKEFIEKGYKLVVEPVAYLTVSAKVTAVTATESAILSRRYDSGYVLVATVKHPSGQPSNYRPMPPSSADPSIIQAYQAAVNASFKSDGYYCLTSGCSGNPNGSYLHQTNKNPYNYHLSSVVVSALPKALFLQKADFGISPGNPPNGNISTDLIVSTYGIGVISYKDVEPTPPTPPSGGDDKPTSGYAYDFIADSVSVHTSPIREENDFDVSAQYTYQQKIDCKYCVTVCSQCGLTGQYPVLIRNGYYAHYGGCAVFSGGPCTCGMVWVPPVYEMRACHLCYVNCTRCDEGELWYKKSLAGQYTAPTKSVTVEIYVDRATLDYTKGISGTLKYTKTMTMTADQPVTVSAKLNAGEKIGSKDVVSRINWDGRNSESNSGNNEAKKGISVIPATNLTVEYVTPNAPFRAGTEIVSSFIIHNEDNIGALNIRPKHNLTADFKAVAPDGTVIDTVQQRAIVIPKKGTNLVYFKWYLPQDYKSTTIKLVCDINKSQSVKEMNYSDNKAFGENRVQAYTVFETPDTIFENRPSYFILPSVNTQIPTATLTENVVSSVSYQRWEWNGDFTKKTYTLSLDADYSMQPDEKSPSREKLGSKSWSMRSGYGVSFAITPLLSSNLPSDALTAVQNGNMYLPEFKYKYGQDVHRSLEMIGDKLLLRQNPYTIEKSGRQDFLRIHFVPLWFPDGEYRVKTYIYDLWSPVGMLSLTNDVSQIEITGDAYDDWYLSHGQYERR